ncbi:hypothetical protein [Azotobacter beijerinckii]|uniref:Uncharacterized protein n=1 Tax=Azotobacter beijerinckii TaxID=170623 RepID=A0A1I0Z374_9GAMM|nr:hypothetical protein [Azotobacter beijerinckii]SFB18723.1 hypothetical protein SAMN04244571_01702 [Azotobacter beijerinckii]
MELKTFISQDISGNVLPMSTCYLYVQGTETLAGGLQDASGGSLTNPWTTNSRGEIKFSAPDGSYDLRIVKGALESKIRVQCNDWDGKIKLSELLNTVDPDKGAGLSGYNEELPYPDFTVGKAVKDMAKVFVARTTKTGNLYIENTPPANIHRFSDRIFLGDAVDNNGSSASPVTSWLGKKDYVAPNGSLQPGLGWIENNATFASYASKGAIGIAGASHTSGFITPGGASIGIVGAAVNDNPSVYMGAYAAYLDAKSYPTAVGSVFGVEIGVANLGDYVDQYSSSNRKTYGILLAAGADENVNGLSGDCTSGINFSNNGARWGVGITFGSGALRAKTYQSATYYSALTLRNSMRIAWEGGAGETFNYLNGYSTAESTATGINLRNSTIELQGATKQIASFNDVSNAVNNWQFSNSADGSALIARAVGASNNIDIDVYPKGTLGRLKLHYSFGSAANPASFSAKKIVEIKDSNGAVYYVPADIAQW